MLRESYLFFGGIFVSILLVALMRVVERFRTQGLERPRLQRGEPYQPQLVSIDTPTQCTFNQAMLEQPLFGERSVIQLH